jgi:hypothetical protein
MHCSLQLASHPTFHPALLTVQSPIFLILPKTRNQLMTECYPHSVSASAQPRERVDCFSDRTPAPVARVPNSCGLLSFADPHPVNSVVSYRYKKLGGRRISPLFRPGTPQKPSSIYFSFQFIAQRPCSQQLSFDNHPSLEGATPLAFHRSASEAGLPPMVKCRKPSGTTQIDTSESY